MSICLPITLFATTLAITAGAIVGFNNRFVNVSANKNNMDMFAGQLSKPETSKLSIRQFNELFSVHKNKNEYINSVAKSLGIKNNHISTITVEGKIKNATVKINATNNYKFIYDDKNTSTYISPNDKIKSEIINDGKTLIFTGVVFAPELLEISQQKVDNIGSNINKITNNLCISDFNALFNGEDEEENFEMIAEKLGVDRNIITSVVANPTENLTSSTITITASTNYKLFTKQTKEYVFPQSTGIVFENKIVFTNVVFQPVAKITNSANPSNSCYYFNTYVDNKEFPYATSSTSGAKLTHENRLTINISSDTTNKFFSVKLPNTVDNVLMLKV